MSDEVKPALTPEEWASFPNWPERITAFDLGWAIEEAEKPVYFPTRHGIAAANLHGQPFGFTREDVAKLRGLMLAGLQDKTVFPDGRIAEWYFSVIGRIEALLPPETPDAR